MRPSEGPFLNFLARVSAGGADFLRFLVNNFRTQAGPGPAQIGALLFSKVVSKLFQCFFQVPLRN